MTDAQSNAIHRIETGASDVQKWALDRHDNSTIVLNSSDIGIYAWTQNDDGTISKQPVSLPTELTETGGRLKTEKYNQ